MREKGIGIEFEFTGVTRNEVARALENYFMTEAKVIESSNRDYPYSYYKINGWVVKRDRSIKPQVYGYKINSDESDYNKLDLDESDENRMDYMCELISPVLIPSTITDLFRILDILRSLGAFVNETCGVHVHIDAPDNFNELFMLFKKFLIEQDILFNEFGVENWRQKKYCRKYCLDNFDFNMNVSDVYELLNYLTVSEGYIDINGGDICKEIRYYGLNIYSIIVHNTVEFRLFNGSLDDSDILKIIDWVIHFAYPVRAYEGYVKVLSSRLALIDLSQG